VWDFKKKTNYWHWKWIFQDNRQEYQGKTIPNHEIRKKIYKQNSVLDYIKTKQFI
jgi:hypothetical protein